MLLLLKKYRSQRAIFGKGNEYFFIHTDSSALKSWQMTALVKSCWAAAHAEYRQAQRDMREAVAVKANIDHLLGLTDGRTDKEQTR